MTPDLAWWVRLTAFLASQTALVVGAATMVNYKLRFPQARRAVWQAALIAILGLWIGESAGFGEKLRALWPRDASPVIKPAGQFTKVTTEPAAVTVPGEEPLPVRRAAPVTWPGEIWLLGTLLLLIRAVVFRVWLFWQRRRMALADVEARETVASLRTVLDLRRVETRIWTRLRGPVAFGWRRPTVALPDGFSRRFTPEQRQAMLAHELAHLAARDPSWLALAETVCALAWWNPLVWWCARQLRVASEAAADEASALVPSGPAALAESLLRFGRELAKSGPARGLGVASFRSGLGRRVNALLASPVKWRKLAAPWRWVPRILALGFVLTLTSLPIVSGPSGSPLALLVQSAGAEISRQASDQSREIPAQSPVAQPITMVALPAPANVPGSNNQPTQISVVESAADSREIIARNTPSAPPPSLIAVAQPGTNKSESEPQQTQPAVLSAQSVIISNGNRRETWGLFDGSNAPVPGLSTTTTVAKAVRIIVGDSNYPVADAAPNSGARVIWTANSPATAKKIVIEVKVVSAPEGSPAQMAMDKLFGQVTPDESAGLEALAQYFRQVKISHPENIRADYRLTKNQALILTARQFKTILDSFEQQENTDVLTAPKLTLPATASGTVGRDDVETVQAIVTGVELSASSPPGGVKGVSYLSGVNYSTSELRTGVTTRIRAQVSADAWNLTVLLRKTDFLGYDKSGTHEAGYTLPLPRLRISEIQGDGTLRTAETLALRGPASTETKQIRTSVLGILHRSHYEVCRLRLYAFVTAISETN